MDKAFLTAEGTPRAKLRMTYQQPKSQSQSGSIQPHRKITYSGSPQIRHEDTHLKQQMTQSQYGNVEELIQSDMKQLSQGSSIQRFSKFKPDYALETPQPKRIHHQSSSVSKDTMTPKYTRIPSEFDNDDAYDSNRYFDKFRLGSQFLPCIKKSDFIKSIQNSEQLIQMAQLYQQPKNLYVSLIQSSQQRCNQKTFGLIQNIDTLSRVNSSGQVKNAADLDRYVQALQTPQCQTIQHIELNNNIFASITFERLLNNFPKSLIFLELMNCNLSQQHVPSLLKYLNKSKVEKLNLENNKFRDQGFISLINGLINNTYLTSLNVNRNLITDISATDLSNYLKSTQYLIEMYLNYNNLGPKSGVAIWKALYKNTSIKIIDLAHNFISSDECSQHITKAITRPYNELLHIDISYNKFNQRQGQEIQEALQKNDSIYGFHFEGNAAKLVINSIGFLIDEVSEKNRTRQKIQEQENVPPQFSFSDMKPNQLRKQNSEAPQLFWKTHKSIFSTQQQIDQKHLQLTRHLDICWICEGWQQIKFQWRPITSGIMDSMPIFLHLDFESYRPLLMTPVDNIFQLVKMCPANKQIKYFFTNPVKGIQTVAKDQEMVESKIQSYEFLYNQEILVHGIHMPFVNTLQTPNEPIFMKYTPLIICKPRQIEPLYDFFNGFQDKPSIWSIETSIFKYYTPDTDDLINQCFEFDFSCSKVTRLVKEYELPEVKELMRSMYRPLFNCYKYYCSNSSTQIPCITMNAFMDLLYQTELLTDGLLKNNDVEIGFISSNNKEKDVIYTQTYEKALVRFQFMEVFLRLCMDKYIRNQVHSTAVDSLQSLFAKDALIDWISKFDTQQQWRHLRLWNEDCDKMLKSKMPFLRLLFKHMCRLNPKEEYSKIDWAQYKDFKDLCNKCQLISEHLTDRETYLCFLLSMMTNIDELNTQRHYQMNFYEFIEALCRLAEKLSIIRNRDYDLNERRTASLHAKIDGLTIYIYLQLKDQLKTQFKEDADIVPMDKCMVTVQKTLTQKLEDSFTDEDEAPYDPMTEMPSLQQQCVPLQQASKKAPSKPRKVNILTGAFSMVSFVQYFNSF